MPNHSSGKAVSGKQKKAQLRLARQQRQEKLQQDSSDGFDDQPKFDPSNFFLKFVNDSDLVVQQNIANSIKKFDFEAPQCKILYEIYLDPDCTPILPERPLGYESMTKDQYIFAQTELFQKYLNSVSPDMKTIAEQYCQFEINIEVYHQLWLVKERSNVQCIITDARFPLPHISLNFINFLRQSGKPIIIIMNKIDLVSRKQSDNWTTFIHQIYPDIPLLATSAQVLVDNEIERKKFVEVLIKLARQQSNITAPQCIKLGFFGQPSVGKSKMINAVYGSHIVRTRLTAGCTKHLQTHYIQQDSIQIENETDRSILIIDSPGLVIPIRNAPRALQLLTGVFPIGRAREFCSPLRLFVESQQSNYSQLLKMIQDMNSQIQGKFGISDEEISEKLKSPHGIMCLLGWGWGLVGKGDQPQQHQAGLKLFKLILEGLISYEIPPPSL